MQVTQAMHVTLSGADGTHKPEVERGPCCLNREQSWNHDPRCMRAVTRLQAPHLNSVRLATMLIVCIDFSGCWP